MVTAYATYRLLAVTSYRMRHSFMFISVTKIHRLWMIWINLKTKASFTKTAPQVSLSEFPEHPRLTLYLTAHRMNFLGDSWTPPTQQVLD